MVGRVELVSAHQRAMLAKLQALPEASIPAVPLYVQDPVASAAGNKGPLVGAIPEVRPRSAGVAAAYESLGRFRDALLAHEWRTRGRRHRRARLDRIHGLVQRLRAGSAAPQDRKLTTGR